MSISNIQMIHINGDDNVAIGAAQPDPNSTDVQVSFADRTSVAQVRMTRAQAEKLRRALDFTLQGWSPS